MAYNLVGEQFNSKGINVTLSEDKITPLAIIGDKKILVSESKLKLSLTNHVHKIGKKNSWITPLSLLSGFLIALITCDFKEFIFSKDVWKALFILITVCCSIWLLYTLKYIFEPITEDDVINELIKDKINIEDLVSGLEGNKIGIEDIITELKKDQINIEDINIELKKDQKNEGQINIDNIITELKKEQNILQKT
jgi:hypothetical protein